MNISNLINKEHTNIPKSVLDKLNRNLYRIPSHPLEIIKKKYLIILRQKI